MSRCKQCGDEWPDSDFCSYPCAAAYANNEEDSNATLRTRITALGDERDQYRAAYKAMLGIAEEGTTTSLQAMCIESWKVTLK